tara:strand:- start:42 stop:188 length:147 start_codon:yes stop_codon:yes gene_type:complete
LGNLRRILTLHIPFIYNACINMKEGGLMAIEFYNVKKKKKVSIDETDD